MENHLSPNQMSALETGDTSHQCVGLNSTYLKIILHRQDLDYAQNRYIVATPLQLDYVQIHQQSVTKKFVI